MIVWGGENNGVFLSDGAIYTPETDKWSSLTPSGAPSGRSGQSGLWTGSAMLVWGGNSDTGLRQDTYTYTPARSFFLYMRP